MKVVHWLLTVAVAWWFRQNGAAAACEHQCGDVQVPYPFGLEINCSRSPEFLLNCTNIGGSGFRLMLRNLIIRKISAGGSTMVVSLPEAYECYDQNGAPANKSSPLVIDLSPNPQYRFSETLNKLTVLGCNTMAVVADSEGTFGSGCISYCGKNDNFTNETTCSGRGCCQASIPSGKMLNISISSLNQNASDLQRGHCARAFVVDNRSFNTSNLTLPRFEDVGNTPGLVLDWMVESDVRCGMAENRSSYACGPNAECKDFGNELGYRCACKDGYEGNPYNRNQGCTDINECKNLVNPCKGKGKCKNTVGSYECHCPSGKKRNKKGHCRIPPGSIAGGAIAVSVLGITITASISVTMRWRLRMINFKRNRGELFKQHKVQIFTEAELAKATNNYNDSNKLSDDHFSSVHKGIIAGDTVVVVKKPKDEHESIIRRDFQDELQSLMKRSHKNMVKLKGICLETGIPLLVYEHITNGTLFQHIHHNTSTILKSWEDRFRIATQAARALNYMHSKPKTPIVHGNIKSANMLLDQNNSLKISDFGTSVLISPEHRHIIATQKKDSLGYIDPEYLVTGMLTTHSDIYSFGVVLVELLTRKKLHVPESGESINTIHRFISSFNNKTLHKIIDFEGASEHEMKRIQSVAEIAVECLNQNGADRLPMSYVAQRLASISPSSVIEKEDEEVDADNLSTLDEARQEGTSSCLSCLGVDSASSCI